MDSNTEVPFGEEAAKDPNLAQEQPAAGEQPAAEEQPAAGEQAAAGEQPADMWYTSAQIMSDQPLSEVGTPQAPLEPEIVMSPAPMNPPAAAQTSPPKKSNTSTIIWVVLLVVLCCSCLCLVLFFSVFSNLLGGIYQVVIDILNSIFNGVIQFQ